MNCLASSRPTRSPACSCACTCQPAPPPTRPPPSLVTSLVRCLQGAAWRDRRRGGGGPDRRPPSRYSYSQLAQAEQSGLSTTINSPPILR